MRKNLLLLLALATLPLYAEIKFIVDGQVNNGFIVTDLDPVPTAQYAARELAEYLEKMTGTTIYNECGLSDRFNAIVVGYGPIAQRAGLKLDGLKHDGFRIVTKNNHLFIYGVDRPTNRPVIAGVTHMAKIHCYNHRYDISAFGDSGTLFGVYYFLREYLGVRWFTPGPLGEVVPPTKNITIPDIDITVNPDFEYRAPAFGLFNYNKDVALWYRRAGFGAPKCIEINHSFYLMNKYQKDHPEWFALLKDGSRDFNTTCEGRGNLCLSNPELLQAFIKEGRDYFDAHPDQDIFCVMPNDWFNQICECPACQAQADYDRKDIGKFSNYVWNFVNEVAKELKKTHPDKFVGCCAYNSYMEIPDRVELSDNIAVMMTKCIYARYDDFYKWRNDELAYEWARKTKHFSNYEYYCWEMTARHLVGLPVSFFHWLETDLRNLKGISKGWYICSDAEPPYYQFKHPAMNSLNYYLTGRLMWNSALNVDDLLEDYYDKFFGPAYEPMKKFWTRAEELWCNMDVKKRGAADNLNGTLYTPAVIAELSGYLQTALELAKASDDDVYAKRVASILDVFAPYAKRATSMQTSIPVTTVKTAEKAPVIDGIQDEVWLESDKLTFGDLNTGTPSADAPTFARLLHDDQNFYVFIKCTEPKMNNIDAHCKVDDNPNVHIWNDDAVELFISPDDRIAGHCVHIIVNSLGHWFDEAKGTRQFGEAKAVQYNSGMTVKAVRNKDNWTVELAIPKESLTLDGTPATQTWRMNICRERNVSGVDTKEVEMTCWSPVLASTWFIPGRFGYVKF